MTGFFEDIFLKLTAEDYEIDGINYADSYSFIEEMHKRSDIKCRNFYAELLKVNLINEYKGETPYNVKKARLTIQYYCGEVIEQFKQNGCDFLNDILDYNKYEKCGIAELVRHDSNPSKVIAKGITAFISSEMSRHSIDNSSYSVRAILRKGASINLESDFFEPYLKHCKEIQEESEKKSVIIKIKRKTEEQLIREHLEQERELLSQSQLFFTDIIDEAERPIIEKIKEAAEHYPKWVKDNYLSLDENKADKHIKDELQVSSPTNDNSVSKTHENQKEKTLPDEFKEPEPLTLESAFKDKRCYAPIMTLLKNNNIVDETFNLLGDRGDMAKARDILKRLKFKNYFEGAITHKQLIEIAKNTFHIDIKLDYMNKQGDNTKVSFIPFEKDLIKLIEENESQKALSALNAPVH